MQQLFTTESITESMKKTNKTKTLCHHKENEYDNKRCVILWKRDEYGLTILTMKNAKGSELYGKPIFYIPLRTFMRCGAFAPDIAPICKGWAKQCIDGLHDWPRHLETEEVFVEIIVFQDSLKDKLMDAGKIHALQVSETEKKDIFKVVEG